MCSADAILSKPLFDTVYNSILLVLHSLFISLQMLTLEDISLKELHKGIRGEEGGSIGPPLPPAPRSLVTEKQQGS